VIDVTVVCGVRVSMASIYHWTIKDSIWVDWACCNLHLKPKPKRLQSYHIMSNFFMILSKPLAKNYRITLCRHD
jgi:hypothetical protein